MGAKMGNLKGRLDRIEEKTRKGAESYILVKFPGKPGCAYKNRTFPSVEAAVEILEKERGCKIKPHVVNVVYKVQRCDASLTPCYVPDEADDNSEARGTTES